MSPKFVPVLLLVISASLAAGPPAPTPGGCGGGYTVARGDTLYSIARRCHSSVVAVAQASGLADPRRIEIGQRLVIPGSGASAVPEGAKPEPAMPRTVSYSFRPGDTLYSLARWARISVPALLAANPGINPSKVEIGDAVRLPAGAVSPEPARGREFGNGRGPAMMRPAAAPAPRVAPPPRPAPPPAMTHPRHPSIAAPPMPGPAKPDSDERRAPEGM